jgi:ureidoglycolate lyase
MLEMVERHPLGSQAFIPMHQNPFLVIVAPDQAGQPGTPLAFVTNGAQAVNIGRDIWHGVLTPLADPGLFTVIDRIGSGNNLEEFWYKTPFRIIPN